MAIDAGDWPRALTVALVAWRRNWVLALADVIDRIDRIDAHLPPPTRDAFTQIARIRDWFPRL